MRPRDDGNVMGEMPAVETSIAASTVDGNNIRTVLPIILANLMLYLFFRYLE